MTITFSWTLIEQYYDHCPEKARQVHVLKTAKEVYTPKIAGGINTHQAIDNHIRKHDLLPSSLEWLKPYIDAFRQGGVAMTEKQWTGGSTAAPSSPTRMAATRGSAASGT
jgi:hypothetical protein